MPEMQFESTSAFTIPDKFTYVCSATKWAAGNLIPIYHLDKRRIASLVVLCGAMEKGPHTATQITDAIEPKDWLVKFARETLKLDDKDIRVVHGDPDSIVPWSKAFGPNSPADLPVICNLQGGTKQMAIGVLDALARSPLSWLRVFVGKFPATVHIAAQVGNDLLDFFVDDAMIKERVPLPVLLDAVGYQSKAVSAVTAYAHHQALSAAMIFSQMIGAHVDHKERDEALAIFKRHGIKDKRNTKRRVKDEIIDFRNFEPEILKLLEKYYGCPVWNSGYISGDPTCKFFQGGWLEQAVLDKVKAAIAHRPAFNAISNFEIKLKGSLHKATEIDILLHQGEVAHLIEVKTSTDEKFIQQAGDKLAANNRLLGGRPAKAWLVLPFMKISDVTLRDERPQRLKDRGVRLLIGERAVDQLLAEIAALP